ncbi:hypothetical protein GCM10023183_33650 [Nibribacter koreensis]|uniref:Uncharacterized protein n=1 Tax=Nibribacter koreensis TaxID=1084519 RepID=A0ABP8FYR9_9BACT
MTLLYIFILPFAAFAVYKRVQNIWLALNHGDTSKVKAELLFLFLTIAIAVGLVLLTYNR